jgi:isopropylmalate/homocitrate/citramalate synthase
MSCLPVYLYSTVYNLTLEEFGIVYLPVTVPESSEQRTETREQTAENRQQRTENRERRTESREQRAREQRAREQRAPLLHCNTVKPIAARSALKQPIFCFKSQHLTR